jgi:hypothetical protein
LPQNERRSLQLGRIQLELNTITPAIDAAFDALYAQIVGGPAVDWGAFGQAVDSFVRGQPSTPVADHFFENATPGWKLLVQAGRFEAAHSFWSEVTSAVTRAEGASGHQLHKGSAYYFWSCNAFQRGDVATALLLMHEALVEDVRTYHTAPGAWPPVPATKVVTLDNSSPGSHPASWWVSEQVASLDATLSRTGSALTIADIRPRLFLASDPHNVFLFVYAHASLEQLERTPIEHRDNAFVGRIALGHLFHIAIVIERAIAAKSGRKGEFMAQVEELSRVLGGRLKDAVPGGRGSSFAADVSAQVRNTSADAVLRGLLNGTATYGGIPVTAIDVPLCISYVLRNIGAHQTEAPPLVARQLAELRAALVRTLADTVRAYY